MVIIQDVKELRTPQFTVCTDWVGNTFTIGSIYYTDGKYLESNVGAYPITTLNQSFSSELLVGLRKAYKNERKAK